MLTLLIAVSAGYLAGMKIDCDYYRAFNGGEGLGLLRWGMIFVLTFSSVVGILFIIKRFKSSWNENKSTSMGRIKTLSGFSTLAILAVSCVVITIRYATPNLDLLARECSEGIYVYSNQCVNRIPVLNIYTSRMGGFSHSGLVFLTKDSARIKAKMAKHGIKRLRLEKLKNGYFCNDFNLNLNDSDGAANYASRTSLSSVSFDFDREGFNSYIEGRSINDRLKPAANLHRVEVDDPFEKWCEIVKFRDDFNKNIPDGFIYSPIPYTEKHISMYNCNTIIAGLLATVLQQENRFDFITDIPWSFGGQTAEDGRLMLADLDKPDFNIRVAKQRDFFNNQPKKKQSLMYRLFYFQKEPIKSIGLYPAVPDGMYSHENQPGKSD